MTKKTTHTHANDVAAAIRAASVELEKFDAEISELHERRREIIDAPRPRKDTIAAARERIEHAARNGRAELDRIASRLANPAAIDKWRPGECLESLPVNRDHWRVNAPLLLALVGDRLGDELERRVNEDARFDDALSEAQRQKELADVDARIHDAENRRAALESELAAAGFLPGNGETEAEQPSGDRGMRAFAAEHERQRQQQIAELERATPAPSPVRVRTTTDDDETDEQEVTA